MTDQITVPRETWDAMLEALKTCLEIGDQCSRGYLAKAHSKVREALTAANAVSAEPKVNIDFWTPVHREPQAQGEAAKKYAENLCISMARKFYPEVTQFETLDDLFGLLTQIDNMTTGLVRPQATEPAWRPIETAPKDGSEILLFGDGRVTSGNWSAPSEIPRLIYRDGFAPEEEWDEWDPYWASCDGGFTEEHPPTHWQPLPAAPEAKQ